MIISFMKVEYSMFVNRWSLGWHVYCPENGYNFLYPRHLRVNAYKYLLILIIELKKKICLLLLSDRLRNTEEMNPLWVCPSGCAKVKEK